MHHATIIGTITRKDVKKNGYILSIRDHQDTLHRIAVWGQTAQNSDQLCRLHQRVQARTVITYTQWNGKWYTNFTAEDIRPVQNLIPSTAVFEGFLANYKRQGNGIVLTIGNKAHSKLGKPTYHRVAIWRQKAEAMSAKLKLGQELHLECTISYSKRDTITYTNFTVETWGLITRPKRKPVNPPTDHERDDDYFVAEPRNRDSRENRLAECFAG